MNIGSKVKLNLTEMASNTAVKMDVDNPLVLKRSSSAPMINDLNTVVAAQAPCSPREPVCLHLNTGVPRMRRFSASFSPLSGPSSPKLTPRVNQLRREESVDVIGREAAHERELNSAMVMSQSWEDLTLVADNKDNGDLEKLSPLTVPLCSTPSPTRPASVPLRHSIVFKTNASLSPSPTRKFTTRRSQSPIAMRPSVLGNSVKRKFHLEENEPPAKRFSSLFLQQARFEPVLKSPTIDSGLSSFDRLSQESSAIPTAKAE